MGTTTLIINHINGALPWFFPLLFMVLGGVFGSFLGCAVYRVAHKKSLWTPPSFCPSCGHTLKAVDLVPVFSWLWFRGRCRQCGAAISPTYLALEGVSITFALVSFSVAPTLFKAALMYGGLMAGLFIGLLFVNTRQLACKSVAFGLLCFGLYTL